MRWFAVACLALVCAARPAAAQAPVDEVLRLVPDDMSLCVVVQDLRGHAERFAKSPWAKLLDDILPADAKNLFKPEEFTKHLGISWRELRDEIVGDAVVFAFRHSGKPDDE